MCQHVMHICQDIKDSSELFIDIIIKKKKKLYETLRPLIYNGTKWKRK